MNEDDFHRYETLADEAGFNRESSRYGLDQFGSWMILLTRRDLPRQRLVWDGKDRTLTIQTPATKGWFLKWFGAEDAFDAALESLAAPVTEEWLSQMEGERAEGWATFYREQALSIASGLWREGRYAEYVETLAPYIEQLTVAQLKRIDLAKRRASDIGR